MEIEAKYSLTTAGFEDLAQDVEIRSRAVEWRTRRMSSEYFDNDLGQLGQKHYTLRLRQEGDERMCCVKYPGGSLADDVKSREELEFPADDIASGVKRLLTENIPEDFKQALERPVFLKTSFEFVRRSCMLVFDTFTCELAMDEGSFGRSTPFREVEFELKSGDVNSMLAFCRDTAQKYGLVPQHESKLARALRA